MLITFKLYDIYEQNIYMVIYKVFSIIRIFSENSWLEMMILKNQMETYIKKIQDELEKNLSKEELEDLSCDYLTHIHFYQHERFVHLIVLVTVAVLTMISIGLAFMQFNEMFIVAGMFFVLLVPYIFHYMYLENTVQKMYLKYNEIREMAIKFDEK